jgi:hypothetical protein
LVFGHVYVGGDWRPRITHWTSGIYQPELYIAGGHPAIEWSDDRHIQAHLTQGQGHAAHYIAQSTGFGEGIYFRSDKNYLMMESHPVHLVLFS